jgi:hypothetical protein
MLARGGKPEDVKERAAKLIADIRKGRESDEPTHIVAMVAAMDADFEPAREALASRRKDLEKQLQALAKTLPVWAWVEGVDGLGALSLAKIVAECGDLNQYANPAKLWKRMGLAVMGSRRQGNPESKTAEEWISHGYSPRRRAIVWNIGECIVKNGKEYRTLFDERKKLELAKLNVPEGTPNAHANNRAKRWVTKRLMKDLWVQWRKCESV